MSIELKQAAQQAVDAFDAFGDADDFASLFELTQKMRALRAAIQQADAQQPATGEPVQADSSGHLCVIASLGAALRRLSFAAQTTGGTDGPDAELQSAIGQAEQALSLGGIWQAMSATTEPVAWMHWLHGPVQVFMNIDEAMMELERLNREYPVDADDRKMRPLIFGDTHPAPSVPGMSDQNYTHQEK